MAVLTFGSALCPLEDTSLRLFALDIKCVRTDSQSLNDITTYIVGYVRMT